MKILELSTETLFEGIFFCERTEMFFDGKMILPLEAIEDINFGYESVIGAVADQESFDKVLVRFERHFGYKMKPNRNFFE